MEFRSVYAVRSPLIDSQKCYNYVIFMVPWAGIEPATYPLGGARSFIQNSRRISNNTLKNSVL